MRRTVFRALFRCRGAGLALSRRGLGADRHYLLVEFAHQLGVTGVQGQQIRQVLGDRRGAGLLDASE